MPRYIIEELQTVRSIRVVEAENEEEAYAAFCDGCGTPTGKDGDVTRSDLVSIVEED